MSKMATVLNTYAALLKNDDIRLKSSSGGMFSLLADHIFARSGVVYGVAMAEDCRSAVFHRADKSSGIAPIRGSKYLQARLGDTFHKVKADLDAGTLVLFTGVGCQINGLKAFLGKEYANLYCVDVICHGAPSPALWGKYVENIEEKTDRKLKSVNFRCKDISWSDFGMKEITSDNQAIYSSKRTDPYMQMFLSNYCLRPSCYECHAKYIKKADITIADFWGIEKLAPEMNDGKGTSLVIVRSEKGRKLFEAVKNELKYKEVSYEAGVKENPVEYSSVARPAERDVFFDDMKAMTFEDLQKKYVLPEPVSFKRKVKKIIKRLIKGGIFQGEGLIWIMGYYLY